MEPEPVPHAGGPSAADSTANSINVENGQVTAPLLRHANPSVTDENSKQQELAWRLDHHETFGLSAGFTLIELLVALAILSLILSLALPRYVGGLTRAEEAVLKENLSSMRDALDKHYADIGRYPSSLDDLVTKRYLRIVPTDPVTRSQASWILVPPTDPAQGGVYDVKSGAQGIGRDGKPYDQW